LFSELGTRNLQVGLQHGPPKALAVEVTYHPAAELTAGWPVLAELSQRIIDVVGPEGPGQPGRWGGGDMTMPVGMLLRLVVCVCTHARRPLHAVPASNQPSGAAAATEVCRACCFYLFFVAAVACRLVLLPPEYSRFKSDPTNQELPSTFGSLHTVVAYKQLLEEATGL
jgi:hypothetical protein